MNAREKGYRDGIHLGYYEPPQSAEEKALYRKGFITGKSKAHGFEDGKRGYGFNPVGDRAAYIIGYNKAQGKECFT